MRDSELYLHILTRILHLRHPVSWSHLKNMMIGANNTQENAKQDRLQYCTSDRRKQEKHKVTMRILKNKNVKSPKIKLNVAQFDQWLLDQKGALILKKNLY